MRNLLLGVVMLGLLSQGCAGPVETDRSGKLLAMAAEEAAGIPSNLERFTRQLNVADTQIRTLRKGDADKTLKLARETLTASDGKEMDAFHRIAGWTAIAQLARAADDRDLALASADKALASLNDVMPVAERALYVLSLSWELAELKGKQDAVELLTSGGGWAAEISDVNQRRMALTAFAGRLVSYDAFEAARTMLRRDADPAWRTDTFLAMANGYGDLDVRMAAGGRGGFGGGASAPGAAVADRARSLEAQTSAYGKDVRFESVYKR